MAEESSIDNELLISLVQQKPILWDKTLEVYKNRVATQAAWKKIMVIIDPNFETKEEKTRQAIGMYLLLLIIKIALQHTMCDLHRSERQINTLYFTLLCLVLNIFVLPWY